MGGKREGGTEHDQACSSGVTVPAVGKTRLRFFCRLGKKKKVPTSDEEKARLKLAGERSNGRPKKKGQKGGGRTPPRQVCE